MARGEQSIHILPDETALMHAAAERILDIGRHAIASRGAFHFALAGGTTPRPLYALLAAPEFAGRLDWPQVHLYFGDERVVPPTDERSNYRMVKECLLDRLPAAPAQVHRVPTELSPQEAAADYDALLQRMVPAHGFDLILLGLGSDGHVASLYPGSDALSKRKSTAAAVYVPTLDSWRVSITLPVINRARHVLLLVAGARKSDVVRHVLRETGRAMPLPVEMLHPSGQVEWLLDAQAARQLERKAAP